MIQLKPVTKQDGNKLKKYYQDCEYGLCEYYILIFESHYHLLSA